VKGWTGVVSRKALCCGKGMSYGYDRYKNIMIPHWPDTQGGQRVRSFGQEVLLERYAEICGSVCTKLS